MSLMLIKIIPFDVRFSLLILAFGLVFSTSATAETNAYGVEISPSSESSATIPSTPTSSHEDPDIRINVTGTTILYHDEIESMGLGTNAEGLWKRIHLGYQMQELKSPLIAKHESWYVSRPDYVKRMLERSQRYLFHIVEEVEKRGMPTEIALLPMVESAFNPVAVSTSNAVGLWQFMPETGKDFGLTQNWWADNRRDVTAATHAALSYLQKLHGLFGSWELALAAYNAGEGTVQRAIDTNKRKGLPTDYLSLNLPEETKNYVPKLQAIKNLMTSPEKYGLSIQTIPDQPYFTKVTAPKEMDAKLAAKLADIPLNEFMALNPEYNRPVLKGGSDHDILLPVTAAETFKENLSMHKKPLVSWQTYHAKRGERMDKIAKKYGVTVDQLREANNLPEQKKLNAPQDLIVPNSHSKIMTTSLEDASSKQSDADSSKPVEHVVKSKETLQTIANRYGVTIKHLREKNKLKTSILKAGQILLIRADVETPTAKSLSKNS